MIVLVTLCTRPEEPEVLRRFYLKARPPGFWGPVAATMTIDVEAGGEGRRQRWHELWHDLQTGLCGTAFCAALVIGMSSALARRLLLAGGS